MKLKSVLFYWLPVILYAGIIFYFSSLSNPLPSGMPSFNYMDLLMHAGEYFILSLLLLRALRHSLVKRPFLLSIAIASLYGITDEIHQLFVPGRMFAVSDMIANAVGASVILVLYILKKKFNKRK